MRCRDVIEYLRRVAPGHHYATSMAPPAAQQVVSALRLIRGDDGSGRGARKIAALHENSNWFRRRLVEIGCNVLGDWNSPVMARTRQLYGSVDEFSRCLSRPFLICCQA